MPRPKRRLQNTPRRFRTCWRPPRAAAPAWPSCAPRWPSCWKSGADEMPRVFRLLIGLAGLMGAAGVALAAAAAHGADASRLASASAMLLFHASTILGVVALTSCGLLHGGIGMIAAFGFGVGAALFAGDLTLRQYAGHALFP